ncbi:MAG: histidine kinase [Dehalococcoidia bacterium]|nr:MAG: histidine kinase [Dehalococcoidia bacterium]UCG83172.1 MAG: histidine kinase [Dehalococcoidia bacterium]
MGTEEIRDLEERIAELRKRIPPHSIPPAMLQELDELEEQLEKARGRERED